MVHSGLIAFILLGCVSLLLLSLSGGWGCELGRTSDEAAHYLTGLMIHDYVAAGVPRPPLAFAENFYAHYPKIAFGIWPPLFHIAEAAWMLVFSPSKAAVLVMLCGICTLLAWLLYRSVTGLYGLAAGVAAGLLLVTLPVMQESTHHVMADSLVALIEFLAVIRWGRYLDEECWSDSAWFGVWSSIAILLKYNGLALALVPPLAIAFARRWYLWKRWQTWLPAGIVLALCASWYLAMRDLAMYAAEPVPHLQNFLPALRGNAVALIRSLGVPLFAVSCAGAIRLIRRPPAERGLWAAAVGLILGCWLFHALSSQVAEARYMLPAAVFLILFLPAGIIWISGRVGCAPGWIAAVLAILYLAGTFTVGRTAHLGYAELARMITARPEFASAVILVSGSAEAEGMAVSEIAIHERRPSHYVLRASKVLASSTWMGDNYRLSYPSVPSVRAALDRDGVSVVILQSDWSEDKPHHQLLTEALQNAPHIWQKFDGQWSSSRHFEAYRRTQRAPDPLAIEIPMNETLHRSIVIGR